MSKNKAAGRIHILVVEDESIVAEDIKDSLEGMGYTVIGIADSGKEAIEKAAETQPNLVLMDIRLKGNMNGLEAAEQIWNRFNIPIVYLTANTDISTFECANLTGSFGYITKPFRERELHTAVEISIYRHQLERKLKEREQWLDTILTSIGDAVIATDDKNCITWLNPAAVALTGWKQEDAFGRKSTEVFNITNEETRTLIESPLTKALHKGVVVARPEQTILIAKNGAEIPIDDSTAPIKDSQGEITGAVLVFRDITERKEAESSRLALARTQQLETQMAELERLNRLKDDFLSTVSHELRTPMANIKMAIKMLELALARSNAFLPTTAQPKADLAGAARYIQILNEECGREIDLINNLLDLQRLEAGVEPLAEEIIHFQTWLPQLLEPFQVRVQNRQQTLQVDLPADLPPLVSDAVSLGRILAELVNNACKYTPPGERITVLVGVRDSGWSLSSSASSLCHFVEGLEIRDKPSSPNPTGKQSPSRLGNPPKVLSHPQPLIPNIFIQVSNSGIEIPAHELPRIFDKFYRVPSTDPWKQGGTGLGLALVQKLTEHLGGYIQVESASGQTCFTVEFPSFASVVRP